MSKRNVSGLLITFHLVVLGAIFLRIDTFPLTWVPMYSQFHGAETLTIPVGDLPRRNRGFEVTTAQGATEFVGPQELNIPLANFRRIYYERAFSKGPPKHLRERAALNPLSNSLFDLFYADPAVSIDWEKRLMAMLNRSLRREPGDSDYIVEAVAVSDFANLGREQRRQGDFTDLHIITRTATLQASVPAL